MMSFHRVLFPFFVPFCFINLSINVYASTSQCLVHQKSSLLQLKHNLIFNSAKSKKLVHWNQSSDCCQWKGVSCNNNGLIIGLDLSEESVTGGLDNSSLFNLEYLQNLNLAYNEFSSLIPTEFDKLKSLNYLNLSNSGFEGQIPIEISHLTRLTTLDLSTSNISQQHSLKLENPDLGMLVQNLTEITELYLDGVSVPSAGNQWSHAISSLRKLQVLSMSTCNLSGPIDSSLANLQSLQVIRLNLNNMSSPVPISFGKLSNLTVLQLGNCELNGVFPKDIFQIQTLKLLDISENPGLHGSLPNFPQDGSLHTLNLSNTNFSGQIQNSISNLNQLSALDLSNCKFNGTLPSSFSELTQLVHLDLSFNNFTGPIPSLNKSKNLVFLSLLHNGFTGPIPFSYFDDLSSLISLNFGDNSLNGRIPSSIFTLPSLQELTLSHNGFNGVLDEFPNASSLSLQSVDLSGNKLEGKVPVSLFHLRKLAFLQLSSNKFNGTVQLKEIRGLPSLMDLGLSGNNLSVDTTFDGDEHGLSPLPILKVLLLASCKLREFPIFLRNQSELRTLDLSNNMIQGTIPNWVWGFESMVYLNLSNNLFNHMEGPLANLSSNVLILDLHSNQLQGTTPIFTKFAVHLDYSNNNFSSVPIDIGSFIPFIYKLSLTNNSIQGKIHESFCYSSTLRMLDLSHNSFNGFIPKCLMTRSSTLRVLNLAGNKLIGNISDTFPSSCSLGSLDLNGNFLSGTIPRSLSNCKNLQVLNLRNNLLSDQFPCFLRNISTLQVLILRSNKLGGSIRCTQNTGDWRMLRIVDLASNNFSGTLPRTLLQSWTSMMADETKSKGNLFFDIYDNHHSVRYSDLLLVLNKVIVMKLTKMLASIPPSMIQNIFSYMVNAEELGGRHLDSITVVSKGLQMNLVKILNVFTSLDFSCNNFKGQIPEELMNLRATNVLNLSNNAFSGHIPSPIGNLKQLESLDLSSNSLSGEIPAEISSLSFLAVLNLSFNHLEGRIPTGTQIQSFDADSFEGNERLCGPPLTQNCDDGDGDGLPSQEEAYDETHGSIDWSFLSAELGFSFGFGIFIVPLLLCKRWRVWYSKHVDEFLCMVIPRLDFVYVNRGGKSYRTLKWVHS